MIRYLFEAIHELIHSIKRSDHSLPFHAVLDVVAFFGPVVSDCVVSNSWCLFYLLEALASSRDESLLAVVGLLTGLLDLPLTLYLFLLKDDAFDLLTSQRLRLDLAVFVMAESGSKFVEGWLATVYPF